MEDKNQNTNQLNTKPNTSSNGFLGIFGRISTKDKIMFTRHTHVMLKSGLSLSRAFEILIRQTEKKNFKEILQNVKNDVERGQPFAAALAKYPNIFSPFYINMVKVGETSGKLEESLDNLAAKLKKDYDLTNKVRSAMMYPSVILTVMLVALVVMIVYVLPQLADVFREINVKLPWTTRAIIVISDIITNYGIFLLIGIILFIIAAILILRTKSGKDSFHKIIIRVPIIGGILKQLDLAKFSRTLNTLMISGVPIVKSFEITSSVLGNILYQKKVFEATTLIKKGVKIVDILEKDPKLFPPLVSQMIAVGEETGNLDEILDDLAEFYEGEVTRTMTDLTSIIEPILLIMLGIGVAIIALSVFSPIYSLIEQI